MTLIDILLVLLIISAAALCVYLIITLNKLNKSVEVFQKDVHSLIEKTIPVMENLDEVTAKMNRVASEAEEHWTDLNAAIETAKDKVSRFSFKTTSSSSGRSENPVQQLIKNLTAVVKGVSAFWSEFNR